MKSDGSLDFPARDGVLLIVVSKPGCLRSNALKDVIDKGVHDAHGLGGDSSVRVHLLQDFVDVDGVTLFARFPPFLGVNWLAFSSSSSNFLSSFGCCFWGHLEFLEVQSRLRSAKNLAVALVVNFSFYMKNFKDHFQLHQSNFLAEYPPAPPYDPKVAPNSRTIGSGRIFCDPNAI